MRCSAGFTITIEQIGQVKRYSPRSSSRHTRTVTSTVVSSTSPQSGQLARIVAIYLHSSFIATLGCRCKELFGYQTISLEPELTYFGPFPVGRTHYMRLFHRVLHPCDERVKLGL